MRILIVTPRYLPEMGGIETHIHEVSKRLSARGLDVGILTTDRSGHLPAEEMVSGVSVRRVPAWPKDRDYYFAPGVQREIMRSSCDLVHVQGYHTLVAPLAMISALRKQVPFVLTFHSGGHSSRLRTLLRLPQRWALAPLVRRAAHCIGVSRFEAEFFEAEMGVPPSRWSVIPNGAEMPRLDAAAAPQLGSLLIMSIGRLERYKGHHRIIEAFPAILEKLPGTRLRILGEGPYKPQLTALAARLGLADRVQIGGIPPGDRTGLAAALGSAALVVLLSDYEAHPVAVMEALALGRRVLVTDCSGLREMADGDVVAAVPSTASPARIAAAAIAHLAKGPLERPIALPTWEDCAERLIQVYRGLLC